MDLPSEADRSGEALQSIDDSVALRHVSLTFADGRQALSDVSLEFRKGEITALVGPTGSGKTSLAYLVPEFYRPTEGSIEVDGIDTRRIALRSIRDHVSYVSDLPDGYDTLLGTVTSKISVGQKQRIAIARGLLKPASVLILDEPTSALDPETESFLVQALREAAKEKLVIIIAHRLSTIVNADKIVFLDAGSVVEQGTHEQLMGIDSGHYREFVELQSFSQSDVS